MFDLRGEVVERGSGEPQLGACLGDQRELLLHPALVICVGRGAGGRAVADSLDRQGGPLQQIAGGDVRELAHPDGLAGGERLAQRRVAHGGEAGGERLVCDAGAGRRVAVLLLHHSPPFELLRYHTSL